MRRHKFILALAATCLLPFGYAQAGTVFVLETKGPGEGDKMEARMSVEAPNLLVDVREGSTSSGGAPDQFIFRGQEQKMLVIDHAAKTYSVMDKESLKAMTDMMGGGGMEAMIQEALKDVPAEQRAQIEQAMREQMGQMGKGQGMQKAPPVEYSKTGETGDQQGYPSTKYVGKQGGEVIRELWVTDWSNIKGGADVRETFKSMAAFWQEAFGSFMDASGENPIELFEAVDGFPVVAREMSGGQVESETRLKSVEQADLGPDSFQPPAGYTQQSMTQ